MAGIGTISGSALAQEESASEGLFDACIGGWDDAPSDFPTVSVRDGAPQESNVPDGEDEVLLYIHGWLEAGTGGGENQGYVLQQALEQNGYDYPVIAGLWSSNSLNWWGIKDVADEAAANFAAWIDDYLERNSNTTFRLVGHSMGGYTSLAILDELDSRQTIDSVALLGASADADVVCSDGKFAAGIEGAADEVHNYHSENDSIMCSIYRLGEFGDHGIGCGGSNCGGWFSDGETPANYEDVDVTEDVDGHCAYMRKDGQGCVDRIVADFDNGRESTDGGVDGDKDGSFGFFGS